MTTWDYRVIKQKHPTGSSYGIYEVYYDDQENIEFITKNPLTPHGETVTELENDLKYMQKALSLPVLDMDELDKLFTEKHDITEGCNNNAVSRGDPQR